MPVSRRKKPNTGLQETSGKTTNERPCKACLKPLVRRDGEHIANYRRRKYCNRQCYMDSRVSHDRWVLRQHADEVMTAYYDGTGPAELARRYEVGITTMWNFLYAGSET